MKTKTTDELENILGSTHPEDIAGFMDENGRELYTSARPFAEYMKALIIEKGIKQQDIFLDADIPERYGYKLLSEEKRTKRRYVILRICYAARLDFEETQKALKIYGMPVLYARIPRDAILITIFNDRPGSIIDVNSILCKNKMEPLRSCGIQE